VIFTLANAQILTCYCLTHLPPHRACRPTVKVPKEVVTSAMFVSVLQQVCSALAFLEEKRVLHRDIAARNVLVGPSLSTVKLGDLGAMRGVNEEDYYRMTSQAQVPLKWMSPEAIREARYTHKSDVWAFGVLAFEVTSFATIPYGNLSAHELYDELKAGYRLPAPPSCLPEL
jgi:serine/threonine protein kinase